MPVSAHVISAEVVTTSGVIIPVNATEAVVTLDEEWTPYGQISLVCSIPEQADLIDPRQGVRVRARLTQSFTTGLTVGAITRTPTRASTVTALIAGRGISGITDDYSTQYNAGAAFTPTTRAVEFGVRTRPIDHVSGEMVITGATDEALLQDYRLLQAVAWSPGSTNLRTIVNAVLGRFGAALVVGGSDGTVSAESTTWEPGQTAWDYLAPLVASAGLRLWCDESRLWRLGPRLAATVPGLVVLSPILTAAADTLSRQDQWADGVVIRYQWTDALGASRVAYDVAGPANATRVILLTRETPSPGAGAAAAILRSVQGRGRTVRSEAVSRYDVNVGQAARIDLAGTPIQTGTVSAVEWRLPDDEMNVRTRDLTDTPDTAWLFLAPGETWTSGPIGPWTE